MVRYAEFVAAGYPIGSGMVESANKVVMEARLTGSGMRWAQGNVNPMLAVRNLLGNQRLAGTWSALTRQAQVERQAERQRRSESQAAAQPISEATMQHVSSENKTARQGEVGHAWRHAPTGRAQQLTYKERVAARR